MRSFYRDTAYLLRPLISESAHGYTAEESYWVELTGVRITAVSGTESEGHTETTHVLRGHIYSDINAGDRIEWSDSVALRTAEVIGPPAIHRGITGSVAHMAVQLKEVL